MNTFKTIATQLFLILLFTFPSLAHAAPAQRDIPAAAGCHLMDGDQASGGTSMIITLMAGMGILFGYRLKRPGPMTRRSLEMTAALFIFLTTLINCGGGVRTESGNVLTQTASSPTPAPTVPPQVVLIGMPALTLGQAAQSIQNQTGNSTSFNNNAATAELVLFTVRAPDGPMPQIREELNRLKGQTLARAAILLTGTDVLTDPELLELVALEVRELLGQYMESAQASSLQVLYANDPHLTEKIQTLMASSPMTITLN